VKSRTTIAFASLASTSLARATSRDYQTVLGIRRAASMKVIGAGWEVGPHSGCADHLLGHPGIRSRVADGAPRGCRCGRRPRCDVRREQPVR